MEKLECLHTLGRNVKWFNLYGKQHEGIHKAKQNKTKNP